jgi:hypothetical protein
MRRWKEMVVEYFKMLSEYQPQNTGKNGEKLTLE